MITEAGVKKMWECPRYVCFEYPNVRSVFFVDVS